MNYTVNLAMNNRYNPELDTFVTTETDDTLGRMAFKAGLIDLEGKIILLREVKEEIHSTPGTSQIAQDYQEIYKQITGHYYNEIQDSINFKT